MAFGRGSLRPGKGVSTMAFFAGLAFVGIGLFVVIPQVGLFGVFWTLVAGAITVFYGMNAFGRGMPLFQMDLESGGPTDGSGRAAPPDFETKLRKLERLREDGLLSADEYQRKRDEIMAEKW